MPVRASGCVAGLRDWGAAGTLAPMLSFILALLLAAPFQAAPPPVTPTSVVAAAPKAAWVAIPPDDLLVMDLAPGIAGRPRRILIQLMPPPFSQGWVGNIRTLARAHWWDGLSVNRVQDNYVAQWGDASEKKPLPAGLTKVPETAYDTPGPNPGMGGDMRLLTGGRDAYAKSVGFTRGFPSAQDGEKRWPVHCYGTVGVGRNVSPDTGTGAELYAVIGHAPRHLDRNIALVGRVVEGIEHLSSLPRGTEALGFYKTPAERVPIRSVRLASDLPPAERPRLEYLSADSASFTAYAQARANRRDDFFIRPAGGADICNVPVPIRRAP